MEHRDIPQQDPLRARFTVWLRKVMQNARNNYLEANREKVKLVNLDALPESVLIWEDHYDFSSDDPGDGFDFEDENLEKMFKTLSPKKQKILTMLLREGLESEEVAEALNCTIQNVYNQKSRAVQELRKKLRDK